MNLLIFNHFIFFVFIVERLQQVNRYFTAMSTVLILGLLVSFTLSWCWLSVEIRLFIFRVCGCKLSVLRSIWWTTTCERTVWNCIGALVAGHIVLLIRGGTFAHSSRIDLLLQSTLLLYTLLASRHVIIIVDILIQIYCARFFIIFFCFHFVVLVLLMQSDVLNLHLALLVFIVYTIHIF